jgi:hypothetical protein
MRLEPLPRCPAVLLGVRLTFPEQLQSCAVQHAVDGTAMSHDTSLAPGELRHPVAGAGNVIAADSIVPERHPGKRAAPPPAGHPAPALHQCRPDQNHPIVDDTRWLPFPFRSRYTRRGVMLINVRSHAYVAYYSQLPS